ncbi:jg21412, partial [Pararge aegeria aegeria]
MDGAHSSENDGRWGPKVLEWHPAPQAQRWLTPNEVDRHYARR